ncbi:MAG TPA: HAD-IA family hydrolase [Candidatus Saccharibacteria bacterium]|nr:HAD-IA family hydrolase [Candidatus Saccharibacteria bacterium]
MVQAIVFDCFGVLYRDNAQMLYDLVKPEDFHKLQDVIHAIDHGFLTRDEYYQAVAEIGGVSIDAVKDVDRRQFSRNDELFSYVESLKPQYKLGLLSNVGQGIMQQLFTEQEREELFDAFVLSSEIGVTKPAVQAFDAVVSQLGVAADETVMVDDLISNIEGAKLAGMNAVLFTSNQQVQQDLGEFLASHA